MKINIAYIVVVCFLLCAAKNTHGILEYEIPKEYDLANTSLLTPAVKLNEVSSKEGKLSITGPRLGITAIKGAGRKSYTKTKGYSSIRVLPGNYDLGLVCIGGSYQEGISQVLTVEAGKEYYLACTGETKRTAKLVITVK